MFAIQYNNNNNKCWKIIIIFVIIIIGFVTPCCTLQNVIKTQKFKPCQLNKLCHSHRFLQGAFHLTQRYPYAWWCQQGCTSNIRKFPSTVNSPTIRPIECWDWSREHLFVATGKRWSIFTRPWFALIWNTLSRHGVLTTKRTRSYWRESNIDSRDFFLDVHPCLMRKDWGSLGCGCSRREETGQT